MDDRWRAERPDAATRATARHLARGYVALAQPEDDARALALTRRVALAADAVGTHRVTTARASKLLRTVRSWRNGRANTRHDASLGRALDALAEAVGAMRRATLSPPGSQRPAIVRSGVVRARVEVVVPAAPAVPALDAPWLELDVVVDAA